MRNSSSTASLRGRGGRSCCARAPSSGRGSSPTCPSFRLLTRRGSSVSAVQAMPSLLQWPAATAVSTAEVMAVLLAPPPYQSSGAMVRAPSQPRGSDIRNASDCAARKVTRSRSRRPPKRTGKPHATRAAGNTAALARVDARRLDLRPTGPLPHSAHSVYYPRAESRQNYYVLPVHDGVKRRDVVVYYFVSTCKVDDSPPRTGC